MAKLKKCIEELEKKVTKKELIKKLEEKMENKSVEDYLKLEELERSRTLIIKRG